MKAMGVVVRVESPKCMPTRHPVGQIRVFAGIILGLGPFCLTLL